ncbi:MAG: 3'(2'),5'-bisphosphate nucleotidase CysQ [Pseudomonadota bacterium]
MARDLADLDLLTEAALAGGEIALKHFGRNVRKWEKDDDAGPVTEADLEVNAMLEERLGVARPNYGWLSEENEDDADRQAMRLAAERVFIIDPIDGTRAFIAGERGFSVALAVAERGEIVAAAVCLPARDEIYAAAKGQGVTKNGKPIRASDTAALAEATVLASQWQMRDVNWPGGLPPLDRHFRSSLAWRMCLVAEGRFDSMVTFRQTYEWDIAAGTLIAIEAGASATDGDGAPFRFNSREGMQPGVISAPVALHREIMKYRRPG